MQLIIVTRNPVVFTVNIINVACFFNFPSGKHSNFVQCTSDTLQVFCRL